MHEEYDGKTMKTFMKGFVSVVTFVSLSFQPLTFKHSWGFFRLLRLFLMFFEDQNCIKITRVFIHTHKKEEGITIMNKGIGDMLV